MEKHLQKRSSNPTDLPMRRFYRVCTIILATSWGLTLSSCWKGASEKFPEESVQEEKQAGDDTPDHQEEFWVRLKGKVNPNMVEGAYQKYGLKVLERVTDSLETSSNTWIMTYDQTSLAAEDMLKILKYSQFVSEAAFHKD